MVDRVGNDFSLVIALDFYRRGNEMYDKIYILIDIISKRAAVVYIKYKKALK